jgi:hypothetical protein
MSSLEGPVAAGASPATQVVESVVEYDSEYDDESAAVQADIEYLEYEYSKTERNLEVLVHNYGVCKRYVKKCERSLNAGRTLKPKSLELYLDYKEELQLIAGRIEHAVDRLDRYEQRVSSLRQRWRCYLLKQEIVAGALHPKRVARMLETGGFDALDCFCD